MSAPTVARVRDRGPAPAEAQVEPDPVSEAARVMALHRWHKPYGHCVGQLVFALALADGGFIEDPDEAGDG